MPPATPDFHGSRLTEAREARGLTGVSLAELAGVSSATISQYEHGNKTPQPNVLARIAGTLNLPIGFFLEASPRTKPDQIYFRSLAAATKAARTKELRQFDWQADIVAFIDQRVELPRVDGWEIDPPTDPVALHDDDVEAAALELRARWDLPRGPLLDLVARAEDHGAIIVRRALGADSLDAYSGWCDERPHVVLSGDKRSAARSRFDLAHEIAHLALHRQVEPHRLRETDTVKELERQANLFAAWLLMPPADFALAFTLPTLDSLLRLKPTWGVSVAAMIEQAHRLNLLSSEQRQRLWIAYRRRWGRREPYDDELDPEAPRVLRLSFDLLTQHGRLSMSEIRTRLPYSVSDIERLSGLPNGYFGIAGAPSVRLRADAPQPQPIIRFPGS